MNSSTSSATRLQSVWVMGLVLFCAVVTLVLPRIMTANAPLSPVSGLVTQRQLAQSAVPYEMALGNGKPTLIEFYADWCTTCQAFAPTLQSVHQSLGDTVNFVMLNIDEPQWQSQIKQYQATGVPHLTLLNTHQTPIQTWVGKVPQTTLLQQIQSSLG